MLSFTMRPFVARDRPACQEQARQEMPALRRLGTVLLLGAAALLPLAPAPAAEPGFALVRPAEAEALARIANGALRAEVIRFADRLLDRAPHAMARLHVEGTLPHQGIYDESREALRD